MVFQKYPCIPIHYNVAHNICSVLLLIFERMPYYIRTAMAKSKLSLRAHDLRRKGYSISEIAEKLKVAKSSASLWCRGVQLTLNQKDRITKKAIQAGHRGRLLGAETNRQKKLAVIAEYTQNGKVETARLTQKELLVAGIALYWGEGSKVGQLSFINADKDMILFMYHWFQLVIGINKHDFMPRIYVNAQHIDRKKEIEKYWATVLDIPSLQFRRTVFIKRPQRKKYANHSNYYGLLSLRIRNSTNVKYRILGLIEGLKCSSF